MPDKKDIQIINVFIMFVLVVGLIYAIVKITTNDSENYCNCTSRQGGRQRVCQDCTNETEYVNGLTENSNLAELQRESGGPTWKRSSPGDYDFPGKTNCN